MLREWLPGFEAVLHLAAALALLVALGWLLGSLVRKAALRSVQRDVAEPSSDELNAAMQNVRRICAQGQVDLVLAGGGAKGAYQVGCWKALRQCGLSRFHAIAGTSVGSLNAVLVAQDDFDKAQSIWHDMSLARVLRFHWHALLALLIRFVLFVPYLGKLMFPARAISVPIWRAVGRYQAGKGDPREQLSAVLQLYKVFLGRPDSSDIVSNLVLAAIALTGLSTAWILAAPLLAVVAMVLVAPVLTLLLVAYGSLLVTFLDQLSTRFVLASNEPLHALLRDCVDFKRLQSHPGPLYVTLASLREVTRTISSKPQAPLAYKAPVGKLRVSRWNKHVVGDDFVVTSPGSLQTGPVLETTVEYAPSHFDVKAAAPSKVNELILQSAGLPEIFPSRCIDGHTYVDGGIVDNVPLAALAPLDDLASHSAIVVIPLDADLDEAAVRADMVANLERLGHPVPAAWPPLIVLTPSRSLGGFLTGTLDFGAHRARALMRLGYRDTIARLAGLPEPSA